MKHNQTVEFEYEEEVKCAQLPYNHEETLKLDKSPIYTRYKQWLKNNGVLIDPRIRYPSYFGEAGKGVVGISVSKPIEKKRAIIAVPYNLLITIDKVKQEIELYEIVKENMQFFKSDQDAAMKLVILYLSFELLKGQKSFYYPYFSISTGDFLSGWESKSLHMLENKNLMKTLRQHKQTMELQFMHFLRIFRRYQNIFPQTLTNLQYKSIYQRSYSFITTRAFGWSLPSISLIPMADSLNHSNIRYLNHFLVNTEQERSLKQKQLLSQTGYKQYRNQVNLAILKDEALSLSQNQLGELRKQKKSKTLKFVEKHKDILIQSLKLEGKQIDKLPPPKNKSEIRNRQYHILHQQYKAGLHRLKHLHFYQSSCEQDNDTDQDELFDRELNKQKFSIYDKERTVSQNNKKKEISKLWKLYMDNSEEDEEEEAKEEEKTTKTQKENEQLKQELTESLLKENQSSEVSYEDSEDSEDPVWEWTLKADHTKTYFVMSTREIIRQNQQIYNFYGRRSNRFLLSNYNFVMEDNVYDSYGLEIRLDPKISTKLQASKLLIFKQKEEDKVKSRLLKLKKYLINEDLINICRSYIILWTKKEWNNCRLITPSDRQTEINTLELYQQIIKHLLKDFTTSIQEDQELMQDVKLCYEERISIQLRKQYKKILKGQELLVGKCLQFLKKWEGKAIQNLSENDMKWVPRLKPYLISLQNSTLV